MDHFRQIPMSTRVAGHARGYDARVPRRCHERVHLGTLVTGVTYRNPAHLGKIIATLDVVSGGRAICGLGLGWYAEEHAAYGWPFPSTAARYALLEDTLELLPLLWGKGTPAFHGRAIDVPEALCYPRPLQAHVPILVGGNGERRTLRLAAQYADACNVIGEAEVVRRKVAALHAHCDDIGRDPPRSRSQLSTTLTGRDGRRSTLVDGLRPRAPQRSATPRA